MTAMRKPAPAMQTRRSWSVLVALGVTGVGCSLMLDPERLDDVERCELDSDCSQLEDERFEMVCTVDPEPEDRDFPKICSPRPVASCAPEDYAFDHVFRTRHHEALTRAALYDDRCNVLGGVMGCPPGPEGCNPGLQQHSLSGRCDDTDPLTPPALAPQPSVSGQDVRDQFCRSLYCNYDFVCDRALGQCRLCELGKPLGHGGCGELYFDGVRSTVYQDEAALAASCGSRDKTVDDVQVGPVPEPALSPQRD